MELSVKNQGVFVDRHIGPDEAQIRGMLKVVGAASLEDLAAVVHAQGISPAPRSGRQERLENIVNNFV